MVGFRYLLPNVRIHIANFFLFFFNPVTKRDGLYNSERIATLRLTYRSTPVFHDRVAFLIIFVQKASIRSPRVFPVELWGCNSLLAVRARKYQSVSNGCTGFCVYSLSLTYFDKQTYRFVESFNVLF